MSPGSSLDEDTALLLARGLEELRAGRYFESHDLLEEAWSGTRGEGREGLKGLVQVAVACYHLEAGNHSGAESQMGKALDNLDGVAERALGIRLAPVRAGLEGALEALRGGRLPDAARLAATVVP